MLFERKNKERVVAVVAVNTTGRSIVMGEELAAYDKVALMVVVMMVMVMMKLEVVVVVMIVILAMTMVLTMMEDVEEVANYDKVIVFTDDN